jgi:hypothetical protein
MGGPNGRPRTWLRSAAGSPTAQQSKEHAVKVNPLTLALAIVVRDLVAITIALLVGTRKSSC